MSAVETYSLDDIEGGDHSVGSSSDEKSERTPSLPAKGQSWPFDIRVIVNPIKSEFGRPFHETPVHIIYMGGKYINIPCPRGFGKVCPMCDKRWNAEDSKKDLEGKGAISEGSPLHNQWLKEKAIIDMYKQRKQFTFMAAKRNDPSIYFFYAGPALTKAIFGDRRKNLSGAIHAIKEYRVSVYAPSEATGWITVNKTGKGLDTVYSSSATTVSKIVGRTKTEELLEEALDNEVVKRFADVESLPRVWESFMKKAWSQEEIENFVASDGAVLPDRIASWLGLQPSTINEGDMPPAVETADFRMDEVIPFGDENLNPF